MDKELVEAITTEISELNKTMKSIREILNEIRINFRSGLQTY